MENIIPEGIKLTPSMKEILKLHQIKLKSLDQSGTPYLSEQISTYRSMLMLQNEELLSAQSVIKREIKKSEMLFESFPLPVFIFDNELNISSGNSAFYRFMNTPALTNSNRNLANITLGGGLEIIKHMMVYNTTEEITVTILKNGGDISETGLRVHSYGDAYIGVLNTDTRNQNSTINIELFRLADSGRMLSAIAHQWKQPLNCLNILLELLSEDAQREETESFKKEMSEIIKYMSVTVKDFLNYSKGAESETIFDIKDCFSFVLKMLKPRLTADHIDCTVICGCGKCIKNIIPDIDIVCNGHSMPLKGSINAIQQVLINLIANAADAVENSSEKSILVNIKAEDGEIVVSVEDTGCGIAPGTTDIIFESGYSTKKQKNGTGIGLNISKNIVENLFNGKISAENTDKGAKFTLVLPMVCFQHT